MYDNKYWTVLGPTMYEKLSGLLAEPWQFLDKPLTAWNAGFVILINDVENENEVLMILDLSSMFR